MFCGKCGKEISDSSIFCKYCGASTGKNQSVNTSDENKKNKLVGILTLAAIAVVVIGIFIGIYGKVYGIGYKRVIKQYVKALENEDSEAWFDLRPDYCNKYMLENWYSDKNEYMELLASDLSEDREYFEDRLGKNFKLKAEEIEVKELSEKRLEEEQEEIREDYDCKDLKIQKAYLVNYKITGTKDGESVSRNIRQYVIKVNFKWYIGIGLDFDE